MMAKVQVVFSQQCLDVFFLFVDVSGIQMTVQITSRIGARRGLGYVVGFVSMRMKGEFDSNRFEFL